MRDFRTDTTALALSTATLGYSLDGHGAAWPVERVIDACAQCRFGGVVFRRCEIGHRAVEIGNRVRAAGMQMAGLRRAFCAITYVTGRLTRPMCCWTKA